jgi:hypothetical protein
VGASNWEYAVPYEPDLANALGQLRLQVFVTGEFVSPTEFGLPAPASLDELMTEPYWEFLGTCGTHSILDIAAGVLPADQLDQDFSTIRPLTDAETTALFGVDMPTRSDFARLSDSEQLYDYVDAGRYTGRAAILWDAGSPNEIVFWGYSGD